MLELAISSGVERRSGLEEDQRGFSRLVRSN